MATSMHGEGERRKFSRFQAPEGSFAALRSLPEKVGVIRDVSKGGLAFEYVLDAFSEPLQGDFDGEIDIFTADRKVALRRLPCCMIRDKRMARSSESFFTSTLNIRLCAIQFKRLEGEDARTLEEFISLCQDHAGGEHSMTTA
ncbi:MAG: hypothetical protein KKA60_01515 [Proteobacteria bacterium]|nr:hypothetical protein [Pseudomonadota bacterium]